MGEGEKRVALLIALVTGGFHARSKYQWCMDDVLLQDEVHTVYYATRTGTYVCICDTNSLMKVDVKFEVKEGKLHLGKYTLYNLVAS
jgi:hypothetical protein